MVLRSLGIAICWVELRPLNLGGESLKVLIDDERYRQLLVVVLKGDLVFPLFRHLHPDCSLPNPSTVGSVGFQQILPCVAVQASLEEVLAPAVLTLVIEEAIEVLDPGEVMLTGFLDQQQIYAGHSIRLGAELVNSHALIPTKYVNGQVIQLLHFWDLRDGLWGINPFEVQTAFGRILRRSVYMVTGWEQGRSECPSEAVAILVFHIDNCLLGPYGCRKWDVAAASQWLISSDVRQRVCTWSTTHPDPLCVHFSSSSKRWEMASPRVALISLTWKRAFCLWRSTGSVNSSVPSGPCL